MKHLITSDSSLLRLETWKKLSRQFLPSVLLLIIGVIVGVVWFGSLRYFLRQEPETHYHANFAVYIDGVREEFKSFTNYEEVAACTTTFADNPKGRAHMHDMKNDVIHVHDTAVTYADFFMNIDWTLGPNFVRTPDRLLVNDENKSWTFLLNGQKRDRVDNLVIGDQDKLLLSYGSSDNTTSQQYAEIENKAKDVDERTDPASCSGINGPKDTGAWNRLKKAFSITR